MGLEIGTLEAEGNSPTGGAFAVGLWGGGGGGGVSVVSALCYMCLKASPHPQ